MDELIQKFQEELEESSFELIEPHFKREAVYCLKKPNDLIHMAIHIANNRANIVKGYLDSGELYKPDQSEANKWLNDTSIRFKFLIVQPFVLIQEK